MTEENFKKACDINNEIKKLEEEFDFLISYENKYYRLFRSKYLFSLEVDKGCGEHNPKMFLNDEDMRTLISLRSDKIRKLRKQLEEL